MLVADRLIGFVKKLSALVEGMILASDLEGRDGDATGGDRRTGGEEGFRRDIKDSNEKKSAGEPKRGRLLKVK